MPGVVRTRVGYAGGTTKDPTYRRIGDHAEAIQIDYDPDKLTYAQLLDVFWQTHNPCANRGTRQYMSAVFYRGEAQKRLAFDTADREAKRRGQKVVTEIAPLGTFYLAEDYHQKYYLKQEGALYRELAAIYPAEKDLLASTAVARVNGYVGGCGRLADLEKEVNRLGLSDASAKRLLLQAKRRER